MSQEHEHKWMVFSTVVDMVSLFVRCECGAVGLVKDPTAEEWSKAYHAPSLNYPWPEPQRVEVLEGWTTVRREDSGHYDVVKRKHNLN